MTYILFMVVWTNLTWEAKLTIEKCSSFTELKSKMITCRLKSNGVCLSKGLKIDDNTFDILSLESQYSVVKQDTP